MATVISRARAKAFLAVIAPVSVNVFQRDSVARRQTAARQRVWRKLPAAFPAAQMRDSRRLLVVREFQTADLRLKSVSVWDWCAIGARRWERATEHSPRPASLPQAPVRASRSDKRLLAFSPRDRPWQVASPVQSGCEQCPCSYRSRRNSLGQSLHPFATAPIFRRALSPVFLRRCRRAELR